VVLELCISAGDAVSDNREFDSAPKSSYMVIASLFTNNLLFKKIIASPDKKISGSYEKHIQKDHRVTQLVNVEEGVRIEAGYGATNHCVDRINKRE